LFASQPKSARPRWPLRVLLVLRSRFASAPLAPQPGRAPLRVAHSRLLRMLRRPQEGSAPARSQPSSGLLDDGSCP
jgi:hypothetical protein